MDIQWAYKQLTEPATQMANLGTDNISVKNSPISESLPYTVPAGCRLGIVSAGFACKISEPNSYMVLFDAFSVPGNVGQFVFPQPFMLPEGFVLNVCFINNSTWKQMMNMVIQGVLIPNGRPAPSPAF